MPIKVDPDKCNGCGICMEQCPGDVIHIDPETSLPMNKYKSDCWYCGVCQMECPTGAAVMEFPFLII